MGEWSVEFSNLVTGIADNVFEIPAGYTRAKVGSHEGEDGKRGRSVGHASETYVWLCRYS